MKYCLTAGDTSRSRSRCGAFQNEAWPRFCHNSPSKHGTHHTGRPERINPTYACGNSKPVGKPPSGLRAESHTCSASKHRKARRATDRKSNGAEMRASLACLALRWPAMVTGSLLSFQRAAESALLPQLHRIAASHTLYGCRIRCRCPRPVERRAVTLACGGRDTG